MSAFLRSWRSGDVDPLADIYEHADEALLSNIPDDRSLDGARSWIENTRAAEAEGRTRAFAIVDAWSRDDGDGTGDEILGNVMATAIEHRHSTAWISYWITADARGRGLTSAALRSLVDSVHDDLGVFRAELGYRTNNPASAGVAKNSGFLVEGRERQRLFFDGVRYDTEVCARLVSDPRSAGDRLPLDIERE